MRDAHNIREVEALGVDWIGMIFYPRSPRYVSTVPADGRVRRAKRVAVFVDAPLVDICKTVRDFAFNLVQLHGKESPQLCRNLREETTQATSGNRAVKLSFTADYTYSRMLTLNFYYDFQSNFPLVSTSSYPTSTHDAGMTLKFTLTR